MQQRRPYVGPKSTDDLVAARPCGPTLRRPAFDAERHGTNERLKASKLENSLVVRFGRP
jgi:hypothetical protein